VSATFVKYEIASINQRLVKQQPSSGAAPTTFVIWQVVAAVVPDNLPLNQQQVLGGSLQLSWPTLPPFQAGDVVASPWPTKE